MRIKLILVRGRAEITVTAIDAWGKPIPELNSQRASFSEKGQVALFDAGTIFGQAGGSYELSKAFLYAPKIVQDKIIEVLGKGHDVDLEALRALQETKVE